MTGCCEGWLGRAAESGIIMICAPWINDGEP